MVGTAGAHPASAHHPSEGGKLGLPTIPHFGNFVANAAQFVTLPLLVGRQP
jgi:hypothetical protein